MQSNTRFTRGRALTDENAAKRPRREKVNTANSRWNEDFAFGNKTRAPRVLPAITNNAVIFTDIYHDEPQRNCIHAELPRGLDESESAYEQRRSNFDPVAVLKDERERQALLSQVCLFSRSPF